MDTISRWRELVTCPDEALPLDEAAFIIAAHASPHLDIAQQMRRLDELAIEVGEADTDRLCHVLFSTHGLHGDDVSYDDPRNSYLDQVLDRKCGIPISLGVVLIEVGRRCGLHLEGVGMPGHFLVRDRDTPDVLIDAFRGGRRLNWDGCEHLLRSVAGPNAELTPAMLAPIGRWATVARMLANLDHSFRARSDHRSLLWVTRLRSSLPGLPIDDKARMADLLAELGRYDEAANLLEALATGPASRFVLSNQYRARAVAIRAQLN